jgi:hypothetical protein
MGGPGGGGRPDRAKQRRVAELRTEGLTLAEIGRRLGLSRQLVYHHRKAAGMAGPRRGIVRCCECAAAIARCLSSSRAEIAMRHLLSG